MDKRSKLKLALILPLNRETFESIEKDQFRPDYSLFGLKYLRDKAKNERDLRELYRGRAPYELLQNADDCDASKAIYILCEEGLAFAHDGDWFTIDNFKNLNDGWSDKDPGECIGHKGLGFRSVLDISPSPYLVQIGGKNFIAIKYSWSVNNGHIQEVLRRKPEVDIEYQKWIKHGQNVCPIMTIPKIVQKEALGQGAKIFEDINSGKYGNGFTTMFWFPAIDPDISKGALESLSPSPLTNNDQGKSILLGYLTDEVSVLIPFLSSLTNVSLFDQDNKLGTVEISSEGSLDNPLEIEVKIEINGKRIVRSYFQSNYRFTIPSEIKRDAETPKAIRVMRDAKVVLAVGITEGHPYSIEDSLFHVYFPTEESTGVGFIIHGDFYVKPDRTRLMENSKYNHWLLDCIAEKAANEFLTQLLNHYSPISVFEALAPLSQYQSTMARIFIEKFGFHLGKRTEPFLHTKTGLLSQDKVILPPTIDEQGFWESHFGDDVKIVINDKISFIDHRVDNRKTRSFLKLCDVTQVVEERILDFIEVETSKEDKKEMSWWYECYEYLVNQMPNIVEDPELINERKIIPIRNGYVKVASDGQDPIVCLPPSGESSSINVPEIFEAIFNFLNPDLTILIENSDELLRNKILITFKISRFEATELLPKAIRNVIPQIFSGEKTVSINDLLVVWEFIKSIINLSPRTIVSSDFWQDIGRVPLPQQIDDEHTEYFVSREDLIPAFLSYFPDEFLLPDASIVEVTDLRRIKSEFLELLCEQSGENIDEWVSFFERANVSKSLKVLTYRRYAVGGFEIQNTRNSLDKIDIIHFIGEKQADENIAVIRSIKRSGNWISVVNDVNSRSDYSPIQLQQLSIIDGFEKCVKKAKGELDQGINSWKDRLWALIIELPEDILEEPDDRFIYLGGRQKSQTIEITPYINKQLDNELWLPTTLGPSNRNNCFSRLITSRLISTGRSNVELGDQLLPYIVANSFNDISKLEKLGIERLENVESASQHSLIKALSFLGSSLQTERAKVEILENRSKWRLVRGAIQEIYRKLNQNEFSSSDDLYLVVRFDEKIEFRKPPIYYADPGSPIERAFKKALPLIDTDRVYSELFRTLNIIILEIGETVNEEFQAAAQSLPADDLQSEIINKLAPYLLAPIIAKAETAKSNRSELIVKRLKERFTVRTVDNLTIKFQLINDPDIEQIEYYRNFYLKRELIPGSGAIQEANFILYAKGNENLKLYDIDADALGDVLTNIFLDRQDPEIAGLFPRIASRYKQLKGDRKEMEEYLLNQLEISKEAQDAAWAALSGEDILSTSTILITPPPANIIQDPIGDLNNDETRKWFADILTAQGQNLADSSNTFQGKLLETLLPPNRDGSSNLSSDSTNTKQAAISISQETRGKKGELEIIRRLQLPGGWEGLELIEDKREDICGYDLLCSLNQSEVYLEIKTFTANGRVIMSENEIRAAAEKQDNYYIIGVLDDEDKSENEWKTYILRNPLKSLISMGNFTIQTRLEAKASDVFKISENSL